MEFEYTITEDEYVKANKLFTKPAKTTLVAYAVVVLALLVIAVIAPSYVVKIGAIGGVSGGYIGHMAVRHLYAPWRTRKQYRAYQAAQESVAVKVLPDSLLFKSSIGEAVIEWSRINKWRENGEFLLIYQAPEVYHIIPKRVGEAIREVRKSLVKYVGKET